MPTWLTDADPGLEEPIALAHTEIETPTEGKVTLRCPWDKRFDIIENIFANRLVWPYYPETEWTPRTFSVKPTPQIRTGVGGEPGQQLNTYLTADVELTFGPVGANAAPSPSIGSPGGGSDIEALYYETYQPNGEMLKLPPKLPGKWVFRWRQTNDIADIDKENLTAEEAPTRLIIGLDYVLRWVGLKEVPEAFFDAPDHVNEHEVHSSAGKIFAPETLLCQAPVISRTVTTAAAEPLWDVEARFSYRKDGWNKFWSPTTATFRSIYKFEPPNEVVGELYRNFPIYDFGPMLP